MLGVGRDVIRGDEEMTEDWLIEMFSDDTTEEFVNRALEGVTAQVMRTTPVGPDRDRMVVFLSVILFHLRSPHMEPEGLIREMYAKGVLNSAEVH